MPQALTVRVLGPLEVSHAGGIVPVGGTKPRAVLTLLGLNAGRVVSGDVLIEVLWGDDPPRTAAKALQTHVSAVRRAVGERVVLTKGAGWVLDGVTTDVARFEAAAANGRDAARAGEVLTAVAAFTEALDWWRGVPELPDTPRAASEVARWVERQETVADERTDALLARGDAAELVGELESAVAQTPLRERRWKQLMLALYRAGRQADALAAFRRARAILDEQLGVQPGPELRRLEAAILDQDAGLAVPRRPTPPRAPPAMDVSGALPVQRTTFVGRQDSLRRLDRLLREHSQVTVTGAGGVGKTRLAIAAAQSAARLFRAGVVFVDLVPVTSAFVVQAVAAALGITERPHQPLSDAVREKLSEGRWLLVLDNCEHVLEAACELVDHLTSACPGVVVLATSRERLGAAAERVVKIPGLDLRSPATGEAKGSEAVTLFLDRSRAVDPGFDPDPEVAGEVCTRLDGVPLAIELAAARCASLGIDGVLTGLDDRMRLLIGARGTPERHRSLRAVLDWSYELLDTDERTLFRQLSIFAGGFDIAAATAVASAPAPAVADMLGKLSDKNLLSHRHDPAGSNWRLLESIRVYARTHLAACTEEPAVQHRHLRWAVSTAERLEARMTAGESWRDGFDAVIDDLRAAATSVATEDDCGYRLASALGHLVYARSFLDESGRHYRHAASLASGTRSARALHAAADVAFAQMRSDVAFDLLLSAADKSAEAGDRASQSIALASAVVLGARCPGSFAQAPPADLLDTLLNRARATSDGSALVGAHIAAAAAWTACPVRARCDGPLGEVALAAARRVGDPVLVSAAMDGLTTVAMGEGRFRHAADLAGRRLDLLRRFADHDPRAGGEVGDTFHMATETAIAAGDLPAALDRANRARDDGAAVARSVGMLSPSRLTLVFTLRGAFADAIAEADGMHRGWERAGQPPAGWMAPAGYAAAMACALTGDHEGRWVWAGRARDLTKDPRVQGFAPFVDCRIALFTGDLAEAVAIAEDLPGKYLGKFDAYARAIAAECAVVAGLPDSAERLEAVRVLAEENVWAAACLARARGRLTGDRALFAQAVAGWERIGARFERACTLLLTEDRAAEGEAELDVLGCAIPAAAP